MIHWLQKPVVWIIPILTALGALNSASDDCFAGGGSSSDMPTWQAINNYTMSPTTGPQGEFWAIDFQGVNRADVLLQKLPGVPGLSADLLKTIYRRGPVFTCALLF
jgi:hypothetical protein